MITWALFKWVDGKWVFAGMTPHDEFVTEFEETYEGEDIPVHVVALEDPETEGVR